jgi:hypothetical protein
MDSTTGRRQPTARRTVCIARCTARSSERMPTSRNECLGRAECALAMTLQACTAPIREAIPFQVRANGPREIEIDRMLGEAHIVRAIHPESRVGRTSTRIPARSVAATALSECSLSSSCSCGAARQLEVSQDSSS